MSTIYTTIHHTVCLYRHSLIISVHVIMVHRRLTMAVLCVSKSQILIAVYNCYLSHLIKEATLVSVCCIVHEHHISTSHSTEITRTAPTCSA